MWGFGKQILALNKICSRNLYSFRRAVEVHHCQQMTYTRVPMARRDVLRVLEMATRRRPSDDVRAAAREVNAKLRSVPPHIAASAPDGAPLKRASRPGEGAQADCFRVALFRAAGGISPQETAPRRAAGVGLLPTASAMTAALAAADDGFAFRTPPALLPELQEEALRATATREAERWAVAHATADHSSLLRQLRVAQTLAGGPPWIKFAPAPDPVAPWINSYREELQELETQVTKLRKEIQQDAHHQNLPPHLVTKKHSNKFMHTCASNYSHLLSSTRSCKTKQESGVLDRRACSETLMNKRAQSHTNGKASSKQQKTQKEKKNMYRVSDFRLNKRSCHRRCSGRSFCSMSSRWLSRDRETYGKASKSRLQKRPHQKTAERSPSAQSVSESECSVNKARTTFTSPKPRTLPSLLTKCEKRTSELMEMNFRRGSATYCTKTRHGVTDGTKRPNDKSSSARREPGGRASLQGTRSCSVRSATQKTPPKTVKDGVHSTIARQVLGDICTVASCPRRGSRQKMQNLKKKCSLPLDIFLNVPENPADKDVFQTNPRLRHDYLNKPIFRRHLTSTKNGRVNSSKVKPTERVTKGRVKRKSSSTSKVDGKSNFFANTRYPHQENAVTSEAQSLPFIISNCENISGPQLPQFQNMSLENNAINTEEAWDFPNPLLVESPAFNTVELVTEDTAKPNDTNAEKFVFQADRMNSRDASPTNIASKTSMNTSKINFIEFKKRKSNSCIKQILKCSSSFDYTTFPYIYYKEDTRKKTKSMTSFKSSLSRNVPQSILSLDQEQRNEIMTIEDALDFPDTPVLRRPMSRAFGDASVLSSASRTDQEVRPQLKSVKPHSMKLPRQRTAPAVLHSTRTDDSTDVMDAVNFSAGDGAGNPHTKRKDEDENMDKVDFVIPTDVTTTEAVPSGAARVAAPRSGVGPASASASKPPLEQSSQRKALEIDRVRESGQKKDDPATSKSPEGKEDTKTAATTAAENSAQYSGANTTRAVCSRSAKETRRSSGRFRAKRKISRSAGPRLPASSRGVSVSGAAPASASAPSAKTPWRTAMALSSADKRLRVRARARTTGYRDKKLGGERQRQSQAFSASDSPQPASLQFLLSLSQTRRTATMRCPSAASRLMHWDGRGARNLSHSAPARRPDRGRGPASRDLSPGALEGSDKQSKGGRAAKATAGVKTKKGGSTDAPAPQRDKSKSPARSVPANDKPNISISDPMRPIKPLAHSSYRNPKPQPDEQRRKAASRGGSSKRQSSAVPLSRRASPGAGSANGRASARSTGRNSAGGRGRGPSRVNPRPRSAVFRQSPRCSMSPRPATARDVRSAARRRSSAVRNGRLRTLPPCQQRRRGAAPRTPRTPYSARSPTRTSKRPRTSRGPRSPRTPSECRLRGGTNRRVVPPELVAKTQMLTAQVRSKIRFAPSRNVDSRPPDVDPHTFATLVADANYLSTSSWNDFSDLPGTSRKKKVSQTERKLSFSSRRKKRAYPVASERIAIDEDVTRRGHVISDDRPLNDEKRKDFMQRISSNSESGDGANKVTKGSQNELQPVVPEILEAVETCQYGKAKNIHARKGYRHEDEEEHKKQPPTLMSLTEQSLGKDEGNVTRESSTKPVADMKPDTDVSLKHNRDVSEQKLQCPTNSPTSEVDNSINTADQTVEPRKCCARKNSRNVSTGPLRSSPMNDSKRKICMSAPSFRNFLSDREMSTCIPRYHSLSNAAASTLENSNVAAVKYTNTMLAKRINCSNFLELKMNSNPQKKTFPMKKVYLRQNGNKSDVIPDYRELQNNIERRMSPYVTIPLSSFKEDAYRQESELGTRSANERPRSGISTAGDVGKCISGQNGVPVTDESSGSPHRKSSSRKVNKSKLVLSDSDSFIRASSPVSSKRNLQILPSKKRSPVNIWRENSSYYETSNARHPISRTSIKMGRKRESKFSYPIRKFGLLRKHKRHYKVGRDRSREGTLHSSDELTGMFTKNSGVSQVSVSSREKISSVKLNKVNESELQARKSVTESTSDKKSISKEQITCSDDITTAGNNSISDAEEWSWLDRLAYSFTQQIFGRRSMTLT